MQTPDQPVYPTTKRLSAEMSASIRKHIRLLQLGINALPNELEPRVLFGSGPPTMAEMRGHTTSHIWPQYTPTLRRDETDPDNYQWYLQQIAQNKGDKLYSTQMGIREANKHGGGGAW